MTNLTVLLMHCIFRVSSDVSCIICSFYFGWWENKLTSASWELWPLFSLLFSSLSPPPTTSGKLINHSYKYPRSTKPNIKVDPSTHFRSFLYFPSGIYSSVLCFQHSPPPVFSIMNMTIYHFWFNFLVVLDRRGYSQDHTLTKMRINHKCQVSIYTFWNM